MRIERGKDRHADVLFVALEPGDKVREELEKLAGQHLIKAGVIVHGIGAVTDLKLAYYELKDRKYVPIDGADDGDIYEVTAFQGNLTWKDGKPFLHAHLVACDREGMAGGGHLVEATVAVTLEIVLIDFRGTVIERTMDEHVGLPLWTFPGYGKK